MTQSPADRARESGDGVLLHMLRALILAGSTFFLLFAGVLGLTWPQQAVLGLLTVLLAIWIDRSSNSYLVTLALMLCSVYSTFRYGYWRIASAASFFRDPASHWHAVDAFFIGMLVAAETYAFLILALGYLQTMWPLRRTPVPLPDDTDSWPAVDLLIPTYNEPLSVVRYTALAAMNIDWPADKLHVYILDDGKREEFRAFAAEAGIGYMTRDDNRHAKAGNINRALERLDAPFVAIFDCDHVPTRSFLQVTMGWFLRDQKLAMLQTPHHFYSPDPFERNLNQFRVIPNEGELFYGIVQDGNDFWNATFFCGSCAVLRRTALDEIGGIAVETVTEDAHTSLRMQMNGWNTAYINIPQAAGLATERLSGHVKQRIRWARGMIQIMRIDNPLFARGLKPAQRLCYFNAMSHFLYALPRMIFLTAPLIYLILGRSNIPGYWAAILAYALPHLILSNITNSRIQGQHRHSFWNEIYETVLSPYILLPTMLAMINPRLGRFDVTAKGGVVNRSFFDSHIAQPFLVMIGFNVLGILMAIPRYWHIPYLGVLYDGTHPGTIVMNLLWTCFNLIILGVATAVAWESQQRRQTVRVSMAVPADILRADGTLIQGVTADMSPGGVMVKLADETRLPNAEPIHLIFPVLDGSAVLPASVVGYRNGVVRAQFDPLTLEQEEALTMVLYSRADTWLGWGESREVDRPLRSMQRILVLSMHGLKQTLFSLTGRRRKPAVQSAAQPAIKAAAEPAGDKNKRQLVTNSLPLLLLFAVCAPLARGQALTTAERPAARAAAPSDTGVPARPVLPGQFDNLFKLSDLNVPNTLELRGVDSYSSIYFSLPETQVVKTATMHLRYHFSPGLLPQLSHLKVSINGTVFATLPVTTRPTLTPSLHQNQTTSQAASPAVIAEHEASSALLETTLTLPAEMLVHDNELKFEFIGHYTTDCEDPSHSTLWTDIDNDSTLELSGALLPLQNDLKLLPLPFYDSAVNLHPSIPIVFLGQPSAQSLQAAGILASWFGVLTGDHPVRFPVSFGAIPQGNAILLTENPANLPPGLNIPGNSGPLVSMRSNPTDPYSKLLVLSGSEGDDLLRAALAIVLQRDLLQGEQVRVPSLQLPAPRQPDDAPRWMSTEKINHLGDFAQTGQLQGDGAVPVGVYLRLPPDLYFGTQQNLALHLGYRYNPVPLANESTLQTFINSAYVSSTPMPHADSASTKLDTVVPVPIMDLRPFSNSLLMKFIFQIAKKGRCQDTAPMNLQGSIMKDSFLDIRGTPHWAVLPNLELFANAGYPFTRKADLADTAVVLPDTPQGDEIELFLTLMGHFGAQTGYPVLNVTVTNADGMKADRSPDSRKDYLVLGAVDDQPAIARLNPNLPVTIDATGLHIQDTQGFFAPLQHAWWKVRSSDHVQSGQLETAGGLPDALLEGLEWPRDSGRSVVLIALRDHTIASNFLSVFLGRSQSSDIAQSISVLHGDTFASYRIGDDVYHVGSLSLWVRINLFFSEFPWVVVLAVFFCCFLMAVILRTMLRRHARERLQTTV
jgi:cellulose synthase (UDP-forming)